MMSLLRFAAKSIPVLVVLLLVVEILWSNTLVRSGKEISSTDIAIASLRQENEALEQQVASASSLLTIAAKATQMGFVEPDKSQFVMIGSLSLPVALNRP